MISFFRRALSSWIVLGFLGLVFVAMIVTGIGTPGSLGDLGSSNGENLARVGDQSIGTNDLRQRLDVQLEALREQQPGAEFSALVRDGTVDKTIAALLDIRAVQAFAESQGFQVSDKLIDGVIAGVAAFKGPTGQFDRSRFDALLDQRNISEKQLRADVARDIYAKIVTGPVGATARAPMGVVTPYASLALEARQGSITLVASSAMGSGTPPTPAELNTFYTRNKARYTVPEMRVIRYAAFDRTRFEGKVTPTEAEIAAVYQKNAAKYGAIERRGLTQIIVQNQTTANAIAAKIKAGTDMNAAAKTGGVEALALAPQDEKAYAALSSAAVAKAVFAVEKGSVAGPVKSGLGWHIVRVDGVDVTAGKSLAAVRSELAAELTKTKTADALANLVTEIDDAVADGQSFEDVVKVKGLTAMVTPPLTASGIAPNAPGYKTPADFAPVLKDAFQAEPDDDPVVIATGPEADVFVDLESVIPAAPRPLAQILPTVTADFVKDRASREAKKIADAIAAKANSGTPIAAAVSGSGKALRSPSPVSARRIDVAQGGDRVPPPLALMFSIPARQAKVLEAPEKQGWFVVWVDKIEPGNAVTQPQLIAQTQSQLTDVVGSEYTQQFLSAIKAKLKVTQDKDAIARMKRSLSGAGAQ